MGVWDTVRTAPLKQFNLSYIHEGYDTKKPYLTNTGFHDVPLLLVSIFLYFTSGSYITFPRHFNPIISPRAFVLLPSRQIVTL